jgi:polysaccharide deacetylase 2 family uncharacterized protein YibQ
VEVTADDLTKPLGLEERRSRLPSIPVPVAPILAGLLVVALGGAAVYVALVDDPLAGQPHAIVPIEVAAAPQASVPAVEPTDGAASAADDARRRSASDVEGASGVSIMRPNGGAAPGSLIIRIPDAETGKLAAAPDRRLVERSRYGLLPKIGADSAKPWQVYARPAGSLPGGVQASARVALLVTGLGISQIATAGAIAKLPGAVTLAFAPYGQELEKHTAAARAEGHEIMLQVPMEAFDYPDNDPGPHTLTARGQLQENLDKLHWAMGRFTGYIGVVNFMGAKLTADDAALAPILREIGSRGLVFLDDGSSPRSTVDAVAAAAKLPAARADAVLDGAPQAEAIDKELARLEEMARRRGFAVGTASALPLTVDRIARWARSLEEKGIQLVPVSTAFMSAGR